MSKLSKETVRNDQRNSVGRSQLVTCLTGGGDRVTDEKIRGVLKGVGIVFVVVGAWNALLGPLALLFMYTMGAFTELALISASIARFMEIAFLFCLVFGLLALGAGIGLIRHRPWARAMAETAVWALLAFIIVFGVFLALLMSHAVSGPLKVLVVGMSAVSMLIPAALVCLLIYWLRSPKVRLA